MKTKILCVLLSVLCLNPLTAAAAPESAPQQAVQTFLQTIRTMDFPVKDPAAHQRLVAQADAFLDLDAMGKRALAAHWDALSAEEQKTFLTLLWKLIETVAYPRSRSFLGNDQITYPEVREQGTGFEVHSLIKQEDEALDVPVVYHAYEKDGQWKIDDIVLDDVSIVEDLKYQFNKLMAQSQFAGLEAKMRERLEKAS